MSPFNYLVYKKGKNNEFVPGEFIVKGQKKYDKSFYFSCFIVRQDDKTITGLENITKEKFINRNITFILGKEPKSTSTSRIPTIYLLEKGIILDHNQHNIERVESSRMLQRVKELGAEKTVIGAFSGHDWHDSEESLKKGLKPLFIPIQIPYNPILIYQNSNLENHDVKDIMEAIFSTGYATKKYDWEYKHFENYIASGVVIQKIGNQGQVVIPEGFNDLFDLNLKWSIKESPHPVALYQINTCISQSGEYCDTFEKVGEGKLFRNSSKNIATLNISSLNDSLSHGIHVLPL